MLQDLLEYRIPRLLILYLIPAILIFFILYQFDIPLWTNLLISYWAIGIYPACKWFTEWYLGRQNQPDSQEGCFSSLFRLLIIIIVIIYGNALAILVAPLAFPYTFYQDMKRTNDN